MFPVKERDNPTFEKEQADIFNVYGNGEVALRGVVLCTCTAAGETYQLSVITSVMDD